MLACGNDGLGSVPGIGFISKPATSVVLQQERAIVELLCAAADMEERRMEHFRSDSRSLRALSVTVILLPFIITGCGSNRSRPLPEFDTVAVTSTVRPAEGVKARGDSDTSAAGAGVGAKGGAAAGAATSLLCGPWFLICLPFLATTGVIVGGVSGSVAGALGDAVDQLPKDQARRARIILENIDERRDFFIEIRDGVARTVPTDRKRPAADAEALIYVGPKKIELVQNQSSHLALRMTAVLEAEWGRDKRTPRREERQYVHETVEMPVEYWLKDDGAGFEAGFTECVDKITQAMTWDLSRSIRTPVGSAQETS